MQVNTSLLKTKFQLVFSEGDSAREILRAVSQKLNDPIYTNAKQFCIVPVLSKREGKAHGSFSLAKYGGKSSDFMELMFNNQQMSGQFDYDASYVDLNTVIKNIKVAVVEVTERVYVDKPMKKQKELPIERKQDVMASLIQTNILAKPAQKKKE